VWLAKARQLFEEDALTYVVTGNCQRCRFTDCITACPVDAFHADDEMVYINPDDCIDCGACEPLCPVHAIHEDRAIEKDASLQQWTEINKRNAPALVKIRTKQPALPTADARKKELGY
jgi:ferredoxin